MQNRPLSSSPFLLSRDKIVSLSDADATQERILDLLENDIAPQTTARDLVVIFFAGHGRTFGNMGYVLPRDARRKGIDRTGISVQRLKETALRMEARHVVFLVDACFSGAIFRKPNAGHDGGLAYWKAVADQPVVEIITAGGEDEEVLEFNGWGAFTRRLHAGLNGAADEDENSIITGKELSRYVEKSVEHDTGGAQHPQWGNVEGEGTVFFWDARLVVDKNGPKQRLSQKLKLPGYEDDFRNIQNAMDRKQWPRAEKLLRALSLRTLAAPVSLLLAEVYLELDAKSNVLLVERELGRVVEESLDETERKVLLELRQRLEKARRGPL